MSEQVRDDVAARRFELEVDGQIVFADYRRENGVLVIRYVEAPPALRGTGASGRLMRGMMDRARGEGLRVVPLCGYAASWIRAHKEYADLLG